MLIVAWAFAVVFLYRDVQVLALSERTTPGNRFAGYAALVLASVAVTASLGESWKSSTQKQFALAAVLVQLVELGIALALRKWQAGRHRWVGCILPCPAFLAGLLVLSFAIRRVFVGLGAIAANEIVAGFWLVLVALLVFPVNRAKEELVDGAFVDDFALLTGCTALIFVPFGLV